MTRLIKREPMHERVVVQIPIHILQKVSGRQRAVVVEFDEHAASQAIRSKDVVIELDKRVGQGPCRAQRQRAKAEHKKSGKFQRQTPWTCLPASARCARPSRKKSAK